MKSFAAIHDCENNTDMQRIPLIRKKQLPVDASFQVLKKYSLLIGLLVGCFILFSTLGANYIAIAVWGDDLVTSSRRDTLIFSLLLSFCISTLALVTLVILRNLVLTNYSSRKELDGVKTDDDENDAVMDHLMVHIECRFIVGALIGVCMGRAFTDLALGITAHIVYSVGTLVVSLVCCRGIMWCFSPKVMDEKDTSSKDDILIV
jgi:hypothetical protein